MTFSVACAAESSRETLVARFKADLEAQASLGCKPYRNAKSMQVDNPKELGGTALSPLPSACRSGSPTDGSREAGNWFSCTQGCSVGCGCVQVASLLREVLDIRLLSQHDSILDENSDPDQVGMPGSSDLI